MYNTIQYTHNIYFLLYLAVRLRVGLSVSLGRYKVSCPFWSPRGPTWMPNYPPPPVEKRLDRCFRPQADGREAISCRLL